MVHMIEAKSNIVIPCLQIKTADPYNRIPAWSLLPKTYLSDAQTSETLRKEVCIKPFFPLFRNVLPLLKQDTSFLYNAYIFLFVFHPYVYIITCIIIAFPSSTY